MSNQHCSGWMMKTAQSAGLLTVQKFMKRFYHFDKVQHILRIFEMKKNGEQVLKQTIPLSNRVCLVDTNIKAQLREGY